MMWIEPEKLAKSLYEQLNERDKLKIRSNLGNFGESIFSSLNYTDKDRQLFLKELSNLLKG